MNGGVSTMSKQTKIQNRKQAKKKSKAVPLHAMEALGGEEV
jgi:hypothetical protein